MFLVHNSNYGMIFFFFFQAEDGIRDVAVTGVQTCALPISPMKPSDAVLIWSSGTVEKWHGVVLTSDSVSGIPYGTSLECDSCRRSIPLVLVDSMKVRHWTAAKTSLVVAGAVAAALVVEYAVCSLVRELTGETC